jgi:hypothetical protein
MKIMMKKKMKIMKIRIIIIKKIYLIEVKYLKKD